MTQFFLGLYDFFEKRKLLFWSVFTLIMSLLAFSASQIKMEEDVTKFFPDDKRVEKLNYVFQNAKSVDRLVVMVSVKDSTVKPQPDSLVALAETLAVQIGKDLKPYVRQIESQVDDEKIMEIFKFVYEDLPVFFTDTDYRKLDSLTRPETVKKILRENYRQLISPAGMVMKKIIVRDPLGFSFLALSKLRQIQYDENFELYDRYIITRDHRHVLFFIRPFFPSTETRNNTDFINGLNRILHDVAPSHPQLKVSYFGTLAVAVGNAVQLRNDTELTVSLIVILLTIFLIGFFRKKRVPFLILIPVLFGGLFSLSCIYWVKGSISILAIAAGSVILGIAVNYALHFLSHLKHTNDVRQVIKDVVDPMTLGSATTVLAFFCLHYTNASVLRDLGLFAGFCLIGAALCSLIFLPHFIPSGFFGRNQHKDNWIERIPFAALAAKKYVLFTILLATPVFFYFAGKVGFDSDVGKLNFMHPETREAQQRLEAITRSSLSSEYVVTDGKNMEDALRKNEQVMPLLQRLKRSGQINKYTSVSTFLISDSVQQIRIDAWNKFWTPGKKAQILSLVKREADSLKFSGQITKNFESLISRTYEPMDTAGTRAIRMAFFDDYIIQKKNITTLLSLVNVDPSKKAFLYNQLKKSPAQVFDKQMLTNIFMSYVNADFNFIVAFTAALVFISLLLSYGRIEITLITFVPMFITWIWILGIMAIAGIQFNIVNVMVSTFIFGLGDDYSIFIMDGLQREYKTGGKSLPSIRTSIFLSAVTTIAGLGVLIFARHPAMRSIAVISIIGILCVFVMSQTIEPYLFRTLITRRTQKGFRPATLTGMVRTTYTYLSFVCGAFLLTLAGIVLRWIPFGKRSIRLMFHSWLSAFTWAVIYMDPVVKKKIIGKTPWTFSRANIIIANHSSLLDILLTTMLHPKLILLTNKWVWNSPVFGGVVRLADYYPVSEGAEESVDRLKKRVQEGYSVVVFPEGSRSENGKLKRFHKGAFYMAEALHIPILPLLIHGTAETIPKTSFHINPGQLTLKFLPAIDPDDMRFGTGYSERTKSISQYFKKEFSSLTHEIETPDYFRPKLIANYLYKGPVLEWYLRIKLRVEKNYAPFHALLPEKGAILDLGCGYGFLCYMLQFLSAERTITGVDYDDEKIETANHAYLKTDRLRFFLADITQYPLEKYDGIIISDVLHYLQPDAQERLLDRSFEALNPDGRLIIRSGNPDLRTRHRGTQFSEFLSTKVIRFNKTINPLSFLSGERIQKLAASRNMTVTMMDDTKFTSNVIFVIRKETTVRGLA